MRKLKFRVLSQQAKADIAWFIRLAESYEKRSRRVRWSSCGEMNAYGVCSIIDRNFMESPYPGDMRQRYFEKVCKPKRAFSLKTWPFYWQLTNFDARAKACRKVAKYIRSGGTI